MDFPMPGRMQHRASPVTKEAAADIAAKREFVVRQVEMAKVGVTNLLLLGRRPTAADWAAEHRRIIVQRANLPANGRPEHLRTPLTDADRIAFNDFFGRNIRTEGGELDPETGYFVGGQETPLSITYAEAGRRAHARFGAGNEHIEELQNTVRLSDGTVIDSNRLVRGERWEEVSRAKAAAQAALGQDVSTWRMTRNSHDIVSIPATQADRERMRQDAYTQLAQPDFTIRNWADVQYKLSLGWEMRGGTDGAARTLAAEAGMFHLNRVPVYPHDIDLLAMTMDQDKFIDYIVEHDRSMRDPAGEPVLNP